MEDRLTRLEENAFFQEKNLEELNAALIGQQRRIDELDRQVVDMRARMEEMRLLLEEARTGGFADTPPPHYGSV